MKEKLIIVIFVGVLVILSNGRAAVAESERYQDYLYQNSVYRQNLSQFKTAKAQYESYQTLTSQTEAIKKAREVLISRNNTLNAYFLLLEETMGIFLPQSMLEKDGYQQRLEKEKKFLEEKNSLLNAAATTSDLTDLSQEIEKKFVDYKILSQQITGLVLLNKAQISGEKVASATASVRGALVAEVKNQQSNDILERWLGQAEAKYQLALQKQAAARSLFFPAKDKEIKFFEGKVQIFNGHQYLKETISNLLEVIRGAKDADKN